MKVYGSSPIRAAIVGAGYIAEFHVRAIQALGGVTVVGVCDADLINANLFAARWNVPKAYASLEQMLSNEKIDCVHVLVPPDLHYPLSQSILRSGIHVFLEKPMSVSVEQADDLMKLAQENGLYLGVNHNMMFFGAYQQLRRAVRSEVLGPIDYIGINYFSELEQIRFGPFGTWMLRSPGNVVLETGPHLFSILLDLIGPPDQVVAAADRQTTLPGGAMVYRRWRVQATAGRIAACINMSFGPGFNERTITIHGLNGTASVDLNADTCLIDCRSSLGMDLDRYKRSRSLSAQLRSQAGRTLKSYLLSKLKLKRGGNPYELSIIASVASYYKVLRRGGPLDLRISSEFGRDVIDYCKTIVKVAGVQPTSRPAPPRADKEIQPTVLVLGGTGFIGRELIKQLVASGRRVRAIVRGSTAVLEDLDPDHVQTIRGDIRREEDLKAAMHGIEYVYHLAVGNAKTWPEYQANEVDSARSIGQLCLACGIKRLIYTGTIDSYYAGAKAGLINEDTPLDPNIKRRNYYARAKAAAENALMELYRTDQLPVVIFRPGIVIGPGGNPFHWGVGRFTENVCEVWGDGNNTLPFVLVADVAAALVQGMEAPNISGRSYNLVDAPLLTSNDYLTVLRQHSGLRLIIQHRPIWQFYLEDLAKWFVKAMVAHPDRVRIPSFKDWESRTQRARFSSARAREELGWKPCGDRERMIEEGIGGSLAAWREATR